VFTAVQIEAPNFITRAHDFGGFHAVSIDVINAAN
jgi:hypothetical protein